LAKAASNDPRTRHVAYAARVAVDLSRVTDRLTDTANIGNTSQPLMHSMQLKKYCIPYILYKWIDSI